MKNRFGAPRGRPPVHSRANEVKCLVRKPHELQQVFIAKWHYANQCQTQFVHWKSIIWMLPYLTWKNMWQAWLQMSLYSPPEIQTRSYISDEFSTVKKNKGCGAWWGSTVLNVALSSCGAIYYFTNINSDFGKCHGTKKWLHATIKWRKGTLWMSSSDGVGLHSVNFFYTHESVCVSSASLRFREVLGADIWQTPQVSDNTPCWPLCSSLPMDGPTECLCAWL